MSTRAVSEGGARALNAAKGKGQKRALLPAKTPDQLKADKPRVKQLYRTGLPRAIFNNIATFSNRSMLPHQNLAPEHSLSANLDDRIAAQNASLDAALGRKLREPQNETTWVVQTRGQYVPLGLLAKELKNRFWHRFYKGSRDAAQAIKDKASGKQAEEDAKS